MITGVILVGSLAVVSACSGDSTTSNESDAGNSRDQVQHTSDFDTSNGADDPSSGQTNSPDTSDAAADAGEGTDLPPEDTALTADAADAQSPDVPPTSDFDPYVEGQFTVNSAEIEAGNDGPPVSILLLMPVTTGEESFPVLIFQHGFLMASSWYSDLLTLVASHGFVIVAPQMYDAGGLPFGKPSTAEEVELAQQLRQWVTDHLESQVTVGIDLERVGYIGHSRGGKVAWSVIKADSSRARAIAGIDPVDGTGGPLGGEARLIEGAFPFSIPTLVIGTGLGPSTGSGLAMMPCAPEGDNHEQFYGAAQSPAYHATVTDHGHLDMLNDDTSGCGMSCSACVEGSSRATMRQTTAGLLVAFFEASLKDRAEAYHVLRDGLGAPAALVVESK